MNNTTVLTKTFIGAGAVLLGLGIAVTASAFGGYGQAVLTDEQKTVVEQAHQLRVDGKYEEARTLLEDNNLSRGFGTRLSEEDRTERQAQKQERREMRDAMRTAIENNDYQAFLDARPDDANAPEITAEIFAQIVTAHNLREAGDIDGARAIMEEIDFPLRDGQGGMGGHRGCNAGQN